MPPPDRVLARTTIGEVELREAAHGGGWSAKGLSLRLHEAVEGETIVDIEESVDPIFDVTLEWSKEGANLAVVADAWERGYGDLGWKLGRDGEIASPWYFLSHWSPALGDIHPYVTGVKTGGGAMACWHILAPRLRLKLDLRSGNRPLRLGERGLRAATITTSRSYDEDMGSYHKAIRALCDHPRLA